MPDRTEEGGPPDAPGDGKAAPASERRTWLTPDRVIAALLLILLLGAAALLGPPLIGHAQRETRSELREITDTRGRIYVESPEVYTRQRLVNDRFAQDAWLRKQLEDVDADAATFIDRMFFERIAFTATAGRTRGDEPDAAAESPENGVEEAEEDATQGSAGDVVPTGSLEGSFQTMFALKSASRDKIRQLILENSLDDRHDLSGNTVYGLKFDTAVIPGTNTHLRPTVVVKMDVDPFPCGDDADACAEAVARAIVTGVAGRPVQRFGTELAALEIHFESWRRNLEFRLNDFLAAADSEALIGEKISAISAEIETLIGPRPSGGLSELERCATSGFEIGIDDIPEPIDTAVHHVFGLPEFRVNIRAQLVRNRGLRNIVCQMAGFRDDSTLSDSFGGAGTQFSTVTLRLPDPWNEFFDLSVTANPWAFELVPKRRALLLTGSVIRDASGPVWPTGYGGRTRCVPTGDGAGGNPTGLRCNTAGDDPDSEFVYLYDRNFDVEFNRYEERLKLSDQEIAALWDAIDMEPHCVLTRPDPVTQMTRVEVVPSQAAQGECEAEFEASSVSFQVGLYEFIRRLLDIDVYSYAAFPRGDVSGVVSNVGASVDLSVTGPAAGIPLLAGLTGERRTGEVQARPRMLNYAAGEDSGAFFDFGWTIVEDGPIDPMLASQMVLVSVPAYLDKLRLRVWRGWLDPDAGPERGETWDDYPTLEDRIDLLLAEPEESAMTVHLPPDYQALDSLVAPAATRLGPLVNEVALSGCERDASGRREVDKPCLRVVSGEAPSVVIPGARLWRSTIVTLGGHQAQQITVMPDMRGIIATFGEITLARADGSDSPPARLDLVVWTSEGADKVANFAEVVASDEWQPASGASPESAVAPEGDQPVIVPGTPPQVQ